MKRVALALLAIAACKERGTITVAFDGSCTWPGVPDAVAVVYAEPNLSCDPDCLCGACFAAKPDGRILYDDACAAGGAVDLDLHPGHWAVVLTVLDRPIGLGGKQIAQGCLEIDLDADGTRSDTKGPATVVDLRDGGCE